MRMIARRMAFYLLTAIVAITVNFFIPRLMPGNPALAVLGRIQAQESKQAIAALEVQYGVQTKTGLWGQYVQYWSHLLHGNLGTSLNFYPASVGGLIRGRAALDASAWSGIATVLSFVLGTLLGVAAAWRRGSWLDGLLPAMTFFQAAPYFFVAILIVALFATKLGWFPPNSGYDTTTLNPGLNWPFMSSVLDHAVLPALTIVVALDRRLDHRDAQHDDHHDGRGLRAARAGQGAARPAGDQLRGPQRAAAERGRLLAGHRVHRLRARCSPRSSSPTRASATCCSPRSAATTTRCCRASS